MLFINLLSATIKIVFLLLHLSCLYLLIHHSLHKELTLLLCNLVRISNVFQYVVWIFMFPFYLLISGLILPFQVQNVKLLSASTFVILCAICYHLNNLKNVKTPVEECSLKSATLQKITLLHGCFSRSFKLHKS